MGQPELSPETLTQQAERELTDAITGLVGYIGAVRDAALNVRANGGDVRGAFLASVPEENRPLMAAQWPMFAMMLGLPAA